MAVSTAVASKTPVIANKSSVIDRIRARVPTYWQYIREKPSWIIMFLFARTLTGRRVERLLKNASYRQPAPASGSILDNLDMNQVVRELIKDGVSVGFRLPADIIRQIFQFAETNICFSRDRQDAGFLPHCVAEANRVRERDVIAAYYFEAVEQSPAITQLTQDPALLSVAAAYLGHAPVLIRIRLWWSFPGKSVSDADLHAAAQDKFHFDMNGWRTLKFFFYLSPTDARAGAHQCIVGSHRNRPMGLQLTLTVGRAIEELEKIYGKERFLTITGDAGLGFAEDPFVFHTGSLCQDRPRLILELEYGPNEVGPSYRYGRLG